MDPTTGKPRIFVSKSTHEMMVEDGVDPNTGKTRYRKANDEEVLNADLWPVPYQSGLGYGKRWKVKSFGNNNEAAVLDYLQNGLHIPANKIIKYADREPGNFGILGDDNRVRLIDFSWSRADAKASMSPAGSHPGFLESVKNGLVELGRDMADLTADVGYGLVAGTGYKFGGVKGAMLAGGAYEYARQKAGQILGVAGPTDKLSVGLASASAVPAPVIAKTTRKIGEKVAPKATEAFMEFAANLAGARGTPTIEDEAILRMRVADKAAAGEPLPSVGNTADIVRTKIAAASAENFPEKPIAMALEERATRDGVTVELDSILNSLRDMTLEPVERQVTKTSKIVLATEQQATKEINAARQASGVASKSGSNLRKGVVITEPGGEPTPVYREFRGSTVDRTTAARSSEASTSQTASKSTVEKTTTKTSTEVARQPRNVETSLMMWSDKKAPNAADDVMDDIYTTLRAAGVSPTADGSIRAPLSLAVRMKEAAQNLNNLKHNYDGKPIPDATRKMYRDVASKLRTAVEAVMDGAVDENGVQRYVDTNSGMTYSQIMRRMKGKMDQLHYWKQEMGVYEVMTDPTMLRPGETVGDIRLVDEIKGIDKAARFIRNTWRGDNYHALYSAARQMEQDFGISVIADIDRAWLGTRIGTQGQLKLRPRITSVGGVPLTGPVVRATQGTAGGILGYLISGGNPLFSAFGAVAAPTASGALASPRGIVGGMKIMGPRLASAGAKLRLFEEAALKPSGVGTAGSAIRIGAEQTREKLKQ